MEIDIESGDSFTVRAGLNFYQYRKNMCRQIGSDTFSESPRDVDERDSSVEQAINNAQSLGHTVKIVKPEPAIETVAFPTHGLLLLPERWVRGIGSKEQCEKELEYLNGKWQGKYVLIAIAPPAPQFWSVHDSGKMRAWASAAQRDASVAHNKGNYWKACDASGNVAP